MSDVAPVDDDARRRIRKDLHATMFVEAGAGTGKTTALVGRVLALIDAGVKMREIAAITFTEAAAAELRDRVRAALDDRLEELGDSPDVERFGIALDDLDGAAVSTLHAFAQRILSEHPVEVGLPPAVDVHDEVSSQIAFEDRWSTFLDRIYEDPALEPTVLRKMASGVDDDALKAVAREFNENWDRLRDHPVVGREPGPVDVEALLAEYEAILAECELGDPADKLVIFVERRVSPIIDWLRDAEDFERIHRLQVPIPKPGGKGAKGSWPFGYDIPVLRQRIRDLDDLRVAALGEVRDQVLRRLAVDLAAFTLEAADERRRQGLLEFHDLLVFARDLLRWSPAARATLHRRYTHLLLDEFQDTDPIQIELAVLIAARDPERFGEGDTWADVEVGDGSLFFVGDPKQSIYRFRRADIQLFLEARSSFAGGEPTELVENFRTVPGIVDFVNRLFTDTMGDGVAGAQPRYEALHAHRFPVGHAVPVTLLGGPHEDALAGELRRYEAHDVASTVLRVLRDGWLVQRPDGSLEAARPSDIAILLPARTSLGVLEEELQHLDIPYRTETGSLVWNAQEVRDLLDVVRAVDDPTDSISIVSALRSPAFGCGDDELFEYHQAVRTWDYRTDRLGALPDDHAVVEAMRWIRELHLERWWLGPSQLVERVARERRLFEFGVLERRARDVWRRLRFVIDRARAYTEAEGGTVRQFLQWADLQSSDVSRPAERVLPEPDDEAVRLLTIHGSKGREFPVTILSGLTTKPSTTPRRPQVLWPAGRPPEISLSKSVTTNQFAPEREAEEQMDRHEKLRLLYVAATRARDHLVIATHHKTDDKSFAHLVWTHAQQYPHLWTAASPDDVSPLERPAPVTIAQVPDRDAWIAERTTHLDDQRRSRTVSATAIAKEPTDEALEPDPRLGEPSDGLDDGEAPTVFRPAARGRAGTAIGRAVHAVLQFVDLQTGSGLDDLARSQAAAESVPWLADQIAAGARAALGAPIVQQAAASGTYWRELYVAVPVLDGDGPGHPVVVEGYVDLLVRTPAGLVVVDYKTDQVTSGADLDAAVDRYRLQGASYAMAIEALLGEEVVECIFVFLGPRGATERSIDDLPGAVAEVRRRVGGRGPQALDRP